MQINLKSTPIPRLFLHYFIPAFISMFVLSTDVIIDGIFVGHGVGALGLAAIGLSVPIFTFFTSIELLFGIGGAALVSMALGANKPHKARVIFNSALFAIIAFGVAFAILGFILRVPLARFLGATSEILPFAVEYLSVIVLGSVVIMAQSVLCIFARNDKAPRLTTISFVVGSILNVSLNYIFIFKLHLGIFGSALATIIGHFVGLLIVLKHFILKDGALYFMRVFSLSALKKSLLSGIAPSLSEFAFGAIVLFMNILLARLDSAQGIAILSIMLYISSVCFGVVLALSHGMQPIVSYNYGFRALNRVKATFKIAIISAFIFGIALYVMLFFFTPQIARIFVRSDDISLIPDLIIAARIYFLGYLFLGFNIITSAFLQAINRVASATAISLAHNLVFMLIFLPILARIFGVKGIWLSYPIALWCAFIVSAVILKNEWRKLGGTH